MVAGCDCSGMDCRRVCLRHDGRLRGDLYLHPFPPSFGQAPPSSVVRPIRGEASTVRWIAAGLARRPRDDTPACLRDLGNGTAGRARHPGPPSSRRSAVWTSTHIATIGNHVDPSMLGEVSRNVRVERFVPQRFVLGRRPPSCRHAGAGRCLAPLQGIPQLLNPLGADQWENADAAAVPESRSRASWINARPGHRGSSAGILNDPQFRLRGRKGGRRDRGDARAGRSRRDDRGARRLGLSTRPPVADVAPDGSPVKNYTTRCRSRQTSLVFKRSSFPMPRILDLGSGPGRLSNPLAAAGHEVVAVDDSAEMLSHVTGASAMLADVWQLDLGRQFDVVIALSHLINDRSPARRHRLTSAYAADTSPPPA